MINPFAEVDWNPDLKARRTFACTLIIGFPILAACLSTASRFLHGTWSGHFATLAVIGFSVGALFWLWPQIARPFYLAWYFLACCLGMVMGNFLLIAIYFLVVTPIGLLVRLLGRGSIRKIPDRHRASYWSVPERVVDPNRYYRQF